MGRADGDWCILTTAGPRTLPLARALAASGIDAWTPTRVQRRMGRGKKRQVVEKVDVAITPTFVFVRAEHVGDLLRAQRLAVSPYPAFRILRHDNRIPLISEASLGALRAAEERFRRSALKSTKMRIEPGTRLTVRKGAFAGMTGIVTHGTDKETFVDLGFGKPVSIASYLIGADVVRDGSQPGMGIAA